VTGLAQAQAIYRAIGVALARGWWCNGILYVRGRAIGTRTQATRLNYCEHGMGAR
jgi:hypothetical protein